MAQQLIQLDQEKLSCSICLDLLKDPVTIPCGHSYCMDCIKNCWDEKETHSCPQCRQTFTPRPVLVKNMILGELVGDLKKAEHSTASSDHTFAGPGDVACDFCSERKLKASKSCLVCMASYCEQHLQPHYNVAPLKKHKLIKATSKLQENICPRHDEVMKIFCRTDQQCICYLCLMDEHKDHVTVSAVAERAEKQKGLETNRQNVQQIIQNREKDVKVLQEQVEAMNLSADKAFRECDKAFKNLISLIEKKSSEVKRQIKAKQKSEQNRVKELQEKIEQEIRDLRRRDTELQQLSLTEDHLHFLKSYSSLSHLSASTNVPTYNNLTLQYFEDVTASVSRTRNKVKALLSDGWPQTSFSMTKADRWVAKNLREPKTRDEFLKYSCQITLDPNTAHKRLSLSDSNRKVTLMSRNQPYPSHPDKFLQRLQVLSRECLAGGCYWEVKWNGTVYVAVAYKDIGRTGTREECGFGLNDKSWALRCSINGCEFKHNNISTPISGPQSSRIGVYLDHRAGTLSFYSITETMNLLHRVQTRFTQPLYVGLWLPQSAGHTAELFDFK
ncbi:tripartite motif-containing protein 16-like isoform X2 [Neolamprologus brichardi]|uniref:tripartite motif-containing protein 16-like isoform X2 n=1 Tax=Neolamprologus brichardi TaxID=32507 RepID=UPI001643BE0F|nr:tripartite motif-containing protein 16-like isoform X2 [Neolamprologus brichardi]